MSVIKGDGSGRGAADPVAAFPWEGGIPPC